MNYYQLPSNLSDDIAAHEADVKAFLGGTLEADVVKGRRVPRGVYEQRQDGTYMTRVRIAAGSLSADQAREIARASRDLTKGRLHVTTRQDVQFHDVDIADTPEIMRRLSTVGLSSKGGGGNTVRNVSACPYAGLCPHEQFDVRPFAFPVTEYLIDLPESFALPRKYKIAFSGCAADCAFATANDVGFLATVRDGAPGFAVFAGGGMGSRPRVGDCIIDFLPAAVVVRAAEAGRRLFDRIGDRDNRHKARLRHAVRRIGPEAFREQLLAELDAVRSDPNVPVLEELAADAAAYATAPQSGPPPAETVDSARVIPQRQPGLVAVALFSRLGDVSADDFERLADLADTFSDERCLRTTQDQGLLIPSVERERVPELVCELRRLDQDMVSAYPLGSFVACAGAATCRLGLCLSRNAARACAETLADAGIRPDVLDNLDIRISGCPNSCAQHQIAAIGLHGAVKRVDGCTAPGYRVVLGGRRGQDSTQFGEAAGFVPGRTLPAFLTDLVRDYQASRQEDESFPDFADRRGLPYFEALIRLHSHIPTYREDPTYFRDIGTDTDFSVAGRKAGECGAAPVEASAADSATPVTVAEDSVLDLTGVPCPLNTARAKLAMDNVPNGGTLRIILDDGEPVERVPTTLRNDGYPVDAPTELDGGRWQIVVRQP